MLCLTLQCVATSICLTYRLPLCKRAAGPLPHRHSKRSLLKRWQRRSCRSVSSWSSSVARRSKRALRLSNDTMPCSQTFAPRTLPCKHRSRRWSCWLPSTQWRTTRTQQQQPTCSASSMRRMSEQPSCSGKSPRFDEGSATGTQSTTARQNNWPQGSGHGAWPQGLGMGPGYGAWVRGLDTGPSHRDIEQLCFAGLCPAVVWTVPCSSCPCCSVHTQMPPIVW